MCLISSIGVYSYRSGLVMRASEMCFLCSMKHLGTNVKIKGGGAVFGLGLLILELVLREC